MGFMQLDGLGDAKEPELIPECRTHLRVDNVHSYVKEDNNRQITRIIHRVEDSDYPDAANIFHYLAYPKGDDEPQTKRLLTLNIKRYLAMANVPFDSNGFNEEDLYGADFDADVIVQETDQGNHVNAIKVPPLPGEEE